MNNIHINNNPNNKNENTPKKERLKYKYLKDIKQEIITSTKTHTLYSSTQKQLDTYYNTITTLHQKAANTQPQTSEIELKAKLIETIKQSIFTLKNTHTKKTEKIKEKISQITETLKQLNIIKSQTNNNKTITSNLEKTIKSYEEAISKKEAETEKIKAKLQQLNNEAKDLKSTEKNTEKNISELIQKTKQKNKQKENIENYLPYLNNHFLEVKGNIRVFCRVRRKLDCEQKEEEAKIEFEDRHTLTIHGPPQQGILTQRPQKDTFNFDYVFPHKTSQEAIFKEVSELVKSSLDGYKVCIFAYGQTGSGKTYTMEGYEGNEGIIPRSIHQIFETIEDFKVYGWDYEVSVSVCEIYLNQINDLLSNKSTDTDKAKKNSVFVIKSVEDWNKIYEKSNKRRKVAETKMNLHSSRSHQIFQIFIKGVNKDKNLEGALNLIDLAGSERLAKSGVNGIREKEAIFINKSLSCLKSVISALLYASENGINSVHVPFRDSVLTNYLQEYLGGDCKTLMFVNISPVLSSYGESISSLKFSSDVNKCRAGF